MTDGTGSTNLKKGGFSDDYDLIFYDHDLISLSIVVSSGFVSFRSAMRFCLLPFFRYVCHFFSFLPGFSGDFCFLSVLFSLYLFSFLFYTPVEESGSTGSRKWQHR